jgi:glycosyltransferase involved in cell wall biosynthesis
MPLYEKADTVARAIESVLAQTDVEWELIVVDDGSSDGGGAIVQGYDDPRIRLVRQANAGVSAARNRGISTAVADIAALIDADDYWSPTHLANLNELIARFPHASLFATAYFMVGNAGQLRKVQVTQTDCCDDLLLLEDYFACASQGAPPAHSSSVAVNKQALAKVGGFPIGVKAGEDLITWARLACIGDVGYSRRATGFFVVPSVAEHRKEIIRRPPDHDYVGNALSGLGRTTPKFRKSLRRYCGEWFRIRAILFLELGERVNSITELGKAIRASGVRRRDFWNLGMLCLPTFVNSAVLSTWRQRGRMKRDVV